MRCGAGQGSARQAGTNQRQQFYASPVFGEELPGGGGGVAVASVPVKGRAAWKDGNTSCCHGEGWMEDGAGGAARPLIIVVG